jgi:hypothetical protein
MWIDKDIIWRAPRDGRPGRPAVFCDAAIQFCLSLKIFFKLPLRQTCGMVARLLKLAGLDWPVPDFSTLCRRQKTLTVQIPFRRADGPLDLLVPLGTLLRNALPGSEWLTRPPAGICLSRLIEPLAGSLFGSTTARQRPMRVASSATLSVPAHCGSAPFLPPFGILLRNTLSGNGQRKRVY